MAFHSQVFVKCLERMNSNKLEKNICQAAGDGTARKEDDCAILSRLAEVRYACRFWALHLEKSSCKISERR